MILPRTLECARLLSFLKNENKQLVFILKINIENFFDNNNVVISQLSKLLKSKFSDENHF